MNQFLSGMKYVEYSVYYWAPTVTFILWKEKKKKLTRTHAIIDLICTADYSLKLAQHGINFKN